MVKATALRAAEEVMERFYKAAAEAGMSFNAWMIDAGLRKLGIHQESVNTSVLRGNTAELLVAEGNIYNWSFSSKRKIDPTLPLYLVAQGRLWVVGKTANGSQRVLTQVCELPKTLLANLGHRALDYVAKLAEHKPSHIMGTVATVLELEATEWYQSMDSRQQYNVINDAIRGDGLDTLTRYYKPQEPVITKTVESVITPEPKEPQSEEQEQEQPLKEQQLRKRYGIDANEWHKNLTQWKKEGLRTVDGLIWKTNRYLHYWYPYCASL